MLQFLTIEPHFVRRVAPDTLKSQFYCRFWRSNLISCERVATKVSKSQFYCSFLTIEPYFVRKSCISWRLVGIAPPLKREIEKKEREEGKRAREREREGKRARERRCEDIRRQDEKMFEDVYNRPTLLEEPFAQMLSGKISVPQEFWPKSKISYGEWWQPIGFSPPMFKCLITCWPFFGSWNPYVSWLALVFGPE